MKNKLLLGCLLLQACVRGPSVESTLPLHRVVIYRGGIGYFERGGRVRNSEVEFRVRSEDVADFLGTLAVMERGGSSVRYAAFPLPEIAETPAWQQNSRRRNVRMSLEGNDHDLVIGYMTATPLWRPTYRIVFTPQGAQFQAWAIVHNTSGEDWRDVHLSLVNGSPVSFRSQLAEPISPDRPLVTDRGQVIDAVPQGETQLDANSSATTTGTSGADRDRDAVPDYTDACPDQPGVPSANPRQSGCPQQVQLTNSQIRIPSALQFRTGTSEMLPASIPVLEHLAGVLRSSPHLMIEVQGHSEGLGTMGVALSRERAEVVRRALMQRGIAAARLRVAALGDSRPLEPNRTSAARARNARVDFVVVNPESQRAPAAAREYANAPPPPPPPNPSPQPTGVMPSMPRSTVALAAATERGMSRFDLPNTVTIPDRTATMVLVTARELPGEATYLFSPDSQVPASSSHPFHVARFTNRTGAQLERGPMAIFGEGAFLGQGMLEALPDGAIATVPFALERGIAVESRSDSEQDGAVLVRVYRDQLTVRRYQHFRTTWTVRNGTAREVVVRVRNPLQAEAELVEEQPTAERVENAMLVPVRVPANGSQESIVHQRRPFRTSGGWTDPVMQQAVENFLREGQGAAPLLAQLRTALTMRRQWSELESRRTQLDQQRSSLFANINEVRDNLNVIRRIPTAADLRDRLTRTLAEHTTRTEALTRQLVELDTQLGEANVRFQDAIRELSYERPE